MNQKSYLQSNFKPSRSKKLLIVSPYFYPHSGGLENYVYNIVKGLKDKYKWEIVVITANHKKNKRHIELFEGIKIYRLPMLLKISNTPINPFWYFQIKKIITNENPDLINAHAPVPFISDVTAYVIKKKPFILTYHAGTMKKNIFFIDLLIKLYEKTILQNTFKKAQRIICSSNFVKTTVAKNYSSKCIVITPAVDTSLFKSDKKIKKERNAILFIGRHANMYRMKGLFYLIDAVNRLKGVNLKVIGEKLPLDSEKVSFLGIKKGKELVKEINQASVIVLCSLAHMESFGMVLIEAMACKTPVIGTKIGGIPEVIDNGVNGLLVPPQNSAALEKAIKKLVKNPKFAVNLAQNGYKKVVNNYIWSKKVFETRNIFVEVLKN